MSEEPRSVVVSYLAALNAHDPGAVCAHVAEDFFNEHVSARGTSLRGREEYRRRLPGFFESMADLHYEVEDVVAEGERVVVAYAMSARYAVAGTRRPFRIRGVFRFTVRDGLIAHRVDYRDGVDFEEQVGLR
ncbi:MAG TPA: nuclear transport factor 2 family protein [Acidimicrobiales bacterium]|nr:nuclear transport factor 2 family protein [Acidimicrobiales bacterium]